MKVAHFLPFTIGIVDYTLRLSEQLSIDHGIESILISVTELVVPPDLTYLDRFPIYELKQGADYSSLDTVLKDVSSLVIHFDFEFLSHLDFFQYLKKKRGDIKFIFMFHEFFPRWPMSWRSKLRMELKRLINSKNGNVYQIRLELVKLADLIFTNTQAFQDRLRRLTDAPVTCVPTFSNVGEPQKILSYSERIPQMIVFGSAGSRERLYQNSGKALVESCRLLGIEEIIDIGLPLGKHLDVYPEEIRVTPVGPQSSQQISEVLSKSMAGFIDYSHNPITISKSGVFAAYSAHGLVTVLSEPLKAETDNLKLDEHYTTWKTLKKIDLLKRQNISTKAFDWYQTHNLTECAKKFSKALFQ